VQKHLDLNLKTRIQLKREGIAIMDYVEMVTPVGQKREVITEWAYARTGVHGTGPSRLAQGCRDTKDRTPVVICPNHDAIGASCLLELSSGRSDISGVKRPELMDDADSSTEDTLKKSKKPRFSTEFEQAAENAAASVLVNGFYQNGAAFNGHESTDVTVPPANEEPSKRYVRFLHDIVIPTLQVGHDALPVAGGWKFYPSPEFRNRKVDLGSEPNGWQLMLVPMSFQAESILIEVPSAFVRNERAKRKLNKAV
jgi:hypothetical protein